MLECDICFQFLILGYLKLVARAYRVSVDLSIPHFRIQDL